MGFLFSLIPLNAFPIALIFLRTEGFIPYDLINNYNFAIAISAILMLTLSIEMIKSAMFAPKGSNAWIDFIMSFLLLIGLFVYIMYIIMGNKNLPLLYWLGLEAQFLDVMVGFYIAISNARRDFNTSGS